MLRYFYSLWLLGKFNFFNSPDSEFASKSGIKIECRIQIRMQMGNFKFLKCSEFRVRTQDSGMRNQGELRNAGSSFTPGESVFMYLLAHIREWRENAER